MTPSPRVDALVGKLRLLIRDRSEFWPPLQNSIHIWAARLPRDLAPGVHRFEVRAVDKYGQVHEAHRLVEVGG